ncbi:MAG TPA: hypothetical protein VGG35_17885 [Streptosporangiaceae bacterium]|jgi:hypothetical protein
MPMTPQEFHAHVQRAAGPDGRLRLPEMAGWETFPFETAGLQVLPLDPPVLPEPDRSGEDGQDCPACAGPAGVIWSDENWQLQALLPSGAPLVLMLQTRAHYDLPGLPDPLAAELGRLIVHLSRAVEGLPHIARAHVSRWGDGGAHLHVFCFARPAGFGQLRGTCMAVWDDVLPPVPAGQHADDAATVARALAASYGGAAAGS